MKREVVGLAIMLLMILPAVGADLIEPGMKVIRVNNYINNLDDFPDYTFIAAAEISPVCGRIEIVSSNEMPGDFYKFCSVSVYAIEKDKFSEPLIGSINQKLQSGDISGPTAEDLEEAKTLFDSIEKKEVIRDYEYYKEIPESNSQEEINNYYTIDLEQVKMEPDRENVEADELGGRGNISPYAYIGIPLIALLIILLLVLRKRKKK